MDRNEICGKICDNIKEIDETEKELCMAEFAIYEKNIEELKSKKLKELDEFFNSQAKFYSQDTAKFEKEIETNKIQYEKSMEKIVSAYNNLFINVFRNMQIAMSNQKIAVGNIINLVNQRDAEEKSIEEKNEIEKVILACAKKKLNYSVIVDECLERSKWCAENLEIDINDVFKNDFFGLEVYKENIFTKLRRLFFNKFSGKKKYKELIENYRKESLDRIKKNCELKIIEVCATLQGVTKQIEQTKKEISRIYSEDVT